MLELQSVLLNTLIVPISYIILAILMGKRRISKMFDVFLSALEIYISTLISVYIGGSIIKAVIKDGSALIWTICSPIIVGFFMVFLNSLVKSIESDFGFEEKVYKIIIKIRNSIIAIGGIFLIVFFMFFIAYGFISSGDYLMLICLEILFLIGLLIILKVVLNEILQVKIKMPEKFFGLIVCVDLLIIILLNLI